MDQSNSAKVLDEKRWLKTLCPGIILGILYAVATYAITVKLAYTTQSDMYAHAFYVVKYWEGEGFESFFSHIPYPGWHALVRLFMFFGIGLSESAGISSACFGFLVAFITYCVVDHIVNKKNIWIPLCATVVLLFVTAIYVPWYNESIYSGQGSPTIWHNPTFNAVKPFALLSCFLLFKMIEDRKAAAKGCVLYAALTVICLFLKPSFFQVQAPAVFIYLVFDLIANREWRFVRNIALSFIPALIYMLLEFWILFYSSSGGGAGVQLSFFDVQKIYAPGLKTSIALFLAFLLYATVILWRDIFEKRSPYIVVFILALVGFCEYAFLMEGGGRMSHGNFAWGYYLAVFIYWVFILSLFLKRSFADRTLSKPLIIVGCILVLMHFVSGICYYMQFMLDATGTMVF